MDFLAYAWTLILGRFQDVFNINAPYGPIALAGALVFTVLFYIDLRRKRGLSISVVGFFKSIFPARIVWHPSSRLDMRLWILNTIVFATAYGMLDYDVLYKGVNIALLQGNYLSEAGDNYFFVYFSIGILTVVQFPKKKKTSR